MNTQYLGTMPEIANEFQVELQEGEKVVFTAKLTTFGTEKDQVLGRDNSKFTLTNQRIIADNGVGTWTIDIAEDVVSCRKVKYGAFIFKGVYFAVDMNKEMIYANGTQKLTGFHFYFAKEDNERFEQIINKL